MATLSPITRKAAWDTLSEMEMQMRYYAAITGKNAWQAFGIRFALLTLAASEGAIFISAQSQEWFPWAAGSIGFLLIGLAVWDALSDYARNAATSKIIALTCEGLKKESEALWREIETDTADQLTAEAKLKSINDRWLMAMAWDTPPTNRKLFNETSTTANAYLQGKYVQNQSQ